MNNIYALKDTKGGFQQPIILPNDQIAERAFVSSFMTREDELMCKFPQDYEMWCLGTYDDRTGSIKSKPHLLITGSEALIRANKAIKIANAKGDE